MAWNVTVVETLTGDPIDTIKVSEFPWADALSTGSRGQCVLPLGAPEYNAFTLDTLEDLLQDWSRTIVLDWDGDVRFAGIINGRDWGNNTVTVKLTDLWGLWDRRLAVDRFEENAVLWSVSYSGLSLGTLAKRVVQLSTPVGASPVSTIPITFQADVAGSNSQTRYGYHLEHVGEVLEDLIAQGIEIVFRPRWLSGSLDWQMLVDPVPVVHNWVKNGPTRNLTHFRRLEDGSRITNNPVFVGEGSGRALLARSHPNELSSLPALDRIEARKNIDDGGALSAMATAARNQHEDPTSEWSWSTLRDGTPNVGAIHPGDTAQVLIAGDRWHPNGTHNRRIVRVSGSLKQQATVVCQPTGG